MNIEVLRDVQETIMADANDIRASLDQRGIRMFNLMGGDGCGKTRLLERLLPRLAEDVRCAVLEGDITTTLDAERIAQADVPVVQLQTGGCCHLEPSLIRGGLDKLPLDELDVIFVENVGNLVCPAEFDIGEHARIAMLSVTEGHDKPAKYPLLFGRADAVIISKMDLLEHTNFDPFECSRNIRSVNANAPIFEDSAEWKLDPEFLDWLSVGNAACS
ncbi:MAG: hydrogenase nickel incorporation protein HypB [Phycisphaerae bacterium]|nr:MAG: hydrogenase nickel incorporation protein HypB [Phycisphaerae bacterium]